MICPCCGQPVPDKFLESIKVTRMEREIIATLRRRDGVVYIGDLVTAIYQGREDGGPLSAEACVRTTICRLNKKLAPVGVRVRGAWGGGYQLEAA